MKQILLFSLSLFASNFLVGQNICGDFKDYSESQSWIKQLKALNADERKVKILERIECEQKSKETNIDFRLTVILNGWTILNCNDIPLKRIKELKLISSDSFRIENSICESKGIYPQKCNLGLAIINISTKPILNENGGLKNIIAFRRKKKIILNFVSDKTTEVKLEISDFIKADELSSKTVKIKKGKNKITISVDRTLKIIEIESIGMKTILLS